MDHMPQGHRARKWLEGNEKLLCMHVTSFLSISYLSNSIVFVWSQLDGGKVE